MALAKRMTMARMWLGLTASALLLAGCGDGGDNGNTGGAASGAPIANVAAPAGTSWLDTVRTTQDGGHLRGNPEAPIRIVEFASYTCPHCAEFAETADEPMEPFIASGKVSFEFRAFVRDPLDLTNAIVARCAGPDVFFGLSHQLFANQATMFQTLQGGGEQAFKAAGALPPNQRFVRIAELAGLIDFAKARGVPEPQLRQCLADPAAAEAVVKSAEQAGKQFDISGTPTIVINGQKAEDVNTWPTLQARLREMGA